MENSGSERGKLTLKSGKWQMKSSDCRDWRTASANESGFTTILCDFLC